MSEIPVTQEMIDAALRVFEDDDFEYFEGGSEPRDGLLTLLVRSDQDELARFVAAIYRAMEESKSAQDGINGLSGASGNTVN